MNKPVAMIEVVHLFPEMRAEFLKVLYALPEDAWARPTACPGWTVKDVALHLLADDVGYLSRHRDNDGITFKVDDWDELLRRINDQNERWVQATRRISRALLLSLLAFTGEQLHSFLAGVDLQAESAPVAWAGPQNAPRWLHVAREFTEYWMHYQHILEAVGVTRFRERRYLHPVLSAFVHALPRTYSGVTAPPKTCIRFEITGAAGDSWALVREAEGWALYAKSDLPPACAVTMDADTAWRLFTKGIDKSAARERTQIEGDVALGSILLDTVAILA